MIKTDETGRSFLSYNSMGRIARIPMEKRGKSAKNHEWVLGSILLEVFDPEDRQNGSARLCLITFDEMLIEQMNTIGVGKDVKVRWHVDVRDNFDNYKVSLVLDSIEGLSESENFLYNTKKKGNEK